MVVNVWPSSRPSTCMCLGWFHDHDIMACVLKFGRSMLSHWTDKIVSNRQIVTVFLFPCAGTKARGCHDVLLAPLQQVRREQCYNLTPLLKQGLFGMLK